MRFAVLDFAICGLFDGGTGRGGCSYLVLRLRVGVGVRMSSLPGCDAQGFVHSHECHKAGHYSHA